MKRLLSAVGLMVCTFKPVLAKSGGDLVVGKIERTPVGLVIYYQNQGPGRLEGKSVSLRISDKSELVTIDGQPLPRAPFEICRTAPIAFSALKMKPRDFYAFTVTIDPRDEIEESKEHNNDYFQQNNAGELTEIPDFSRYSGVAKLKIESVEVVGPGQLQVKVKNHGSGISMAQYATRLTINGVSNNLVTQHYQPLPLPDQFDSWIFRFEKWGVKPGERVNLKLELDPDRRLPGSQAPQQTMSTSMLMGPSSQAAKSSVSSARETLGRVGTKDFQWTPKSSYICWVPEHSMLSVNFFPFQLGPDDHLGLLYNDPRRVVKDRAKKLPPSARKKGVPDGEPYAQLNIELHPGTTQLSPQNIVRVSWMVGNNKGGGSKPCDLKDLHWDKSSIKDGQTIQLKAKSQQAQETLEIASRGTIHQCQIPESIHNPAQPHSIPKSSIQGLVRADGLTLTPKAAIGFYYPKQKKLHLMFMARPIESDDMPDFRRGWLGVKKPFAPPNAIASFTAIFDLADANFSNVSVSLTKTRGGHNGSLLPGDEGHKVVLKAPKFAQGQSFSFRLRGKVQMGAIKSPVEIDLAGNAAMMEVDQ